MSYYFLCPVIQQYNLVPVCGRLRSAAGKVTVEMASHCGHALQTAVAQPSIQTPGLKVRPSPVVTRDVPDSQFQFRLAGYPAIFAIRFRFRPNSKIYNLVHL